MFIFDILVKRLNVYLVCVGDNFRFGVGCLEDFNFLKKMGCYFGFKVIKMCVYTDNSGEKISSTTVCNAFREDQLTRAEVFLGHAYLVSGRVIYGKKFGTTIGFPTLNISLKGKRLAIHGVYAVKVYEGVANKWYLGIANIGFCPTVHKYSQQRLEVHLLDQAMDLYGYYLKIMVCAKIRNEQNFPSIEALKLQIKNDIKNVKRHFNE